MKVEEESEKVGLKLNIQKTKIMASDPITSCQICGETVTDFIFLGSKSLQMMTELSWNFLPYYLFNYLLLCFSSPVLGSVQFSSVMCNSLRPHGLQHQASLSITNSQSLLKLKSIESGDAIQPSHPLSSPSLPAFNLSQHQGFSNE